MASVEVSKSGFDLVFHTIAGAFNYDSFSVMKESIQHRGGDGAVAIEDGRPLLESFVGSDDEGTALISLTDDLEKKVGSALIYGEVADLIQQKQRRSQIAFKFGFKDPVGLSGAQGVDDIDGISKQDAIAVLAGSVGECCGQVSFAQTNQTKEDHIGFLLDEAQSEKILDLESSDVFWPVPTEGQQSFYNGKNGLFDSTGKGTKHPSRPIAHHHTTEVNDIAPMLGGSLNSKCAAVKF